MKNSIPINTWLMVVILAMATFLRLFHLGMPTLNSDELTIIMPSRLSWEFLFNYVRQNSTAMPTFYAFTKILTHFVQSDFGVRFLEAACGIVTVFSVYYFGRRHFSELTSILAASFISMNELHLWVSRQARPYAFFLFLVLLSFHFFLSYLKSETRKDLYKLLTVNLFMISLHFLSLFVVMSQSVVLLYYYFFSSKYKLSDIIIYHFISALCFIPNMYFLHYISTNQKEIFHNNTLGIIFNGLWLAYESCLGLYESSNALVFVSLLLIIGFLIWLTSNRTMFIISASSLLCPVAFVTATKIAAISGQHHLSFLMFLFSFCAADAVMTIAKKQNIQRFFISIISIFLFINVIYKQYNNYYTQSNTLQWYNLGNYKTISSELPKHIPDGQVTFCHDTFFSECINWYLAQSSHPSLLKKQNITADKPAITVNFLTTSLPHSLSQDYPELSTSLGAYRSCDTFDVAHLFKWEIQRTPVHAITALPYRSDFTARPRDFYENIYESSNLTIHPYFGSTAIPTRYDTPAFAVYTLTNNTQVSQSVFHLVFDYANASRKNSISLAYKFDDENYTTVFNSTGIDPTTQQFLTIPRDKPFHSLFLKVEIVCFSKDPTTSMTNLHLTGFKRLQVYACDAFSDNQCQLAMLSENLPAGFPSGSTASQDMLPERSANLISHSTDTPLWSCWTQQALDRPAVLALRLPNSTVPLAFFPRLCGPRSQFIVTARSKGRSQVLFQLSGPKADCTNIGLRFPFPPPPDWAEWLEIQLQGGAQIFSRDNAIVFPF